MPARCKANTGAGAGRACGSGDACGGDREVGERRASGSIRAAKGIGPRTYPQHALEHKRRHEVTDEVRKGSDKPRPPFLELLRGGERGVKAKEAGSSTAYSRAHL